MPITLNHSNIGVQYSTGSNYIIETVKSDLYLRDTRTDITSNLLAEPILISPAMTETVRSFIHSGGSEAQTTHTITVGQNTVCDILIVGGGGCGGRSGGGGGAVIYTQNVLFPTGTYSIKVGNGGISIKSGDIGNTQGANGNDSEILFNTTTIFRAKGGGFGGPNNTAAGGTGGSGGGSENVANNSAVSNTNIISTNTLSSSFTTLTNQSPNGSTIRGNIGGKGAVHSSFYYYLGGGGGGAGSAGGNGNTTNATSGSGGDGVNIDITGSLVMYGSGGAGGIYNDYSFGANNITAISGTVSSGGGTGAYASRTQSVFGSVPTAGQGGGGGGWSVNSLTSQNIYARDGGSGIVIIKFKSMIAIPEGNPITHKRLNFAYNSDNLVAWYKFNGDYLDSSGNGHNLTNVGTVIQSTHIIEGQAVEFDSTDYLEFPATINPYTIWNGKGITFSCWVRITAHETNAVLIDFQPSLSNSQGLLIGLKTTTGGNKALIIYVNNNFVFNWSDWNNPLITNLNVWRHLVFSVSSSGRWDVYLDNVRINGTETANIPNITYNFRFINRSVWSSTIMWDGQMDDFRIYDRALSAADVSLLYNKTYLVPPNIYTLNFPVPTIADINNNSNIVLRGAYDISLSTMNSSIIPKTGQYIPKPTSFTNYNIERMYPPVRNFTAATTTVSGQTYGNGTYIVSYSSFLTPFEPFKCFNTSSTIGGHWIDAYTDGNYTGSAFIVAGYLGDWLKIQLPVAIKLTRFEFLMRNEGVQALRVRSPKDFKIYGSNDNITWVELVNKTGAVYNASYIYEQTTPEITNTYTYYGLVVNKLFSGAVLNFDEWYIYGQEVLPSSLSIRYNLLNPTLDPVGAQWTYNSSNTNVYHMGSVGIGTKSPEYHLDVRGSIYSSLGGYTQTGLTTWSIASDRRIKENIVKASYDKCLENVKNIELYNFNFKDDCVNTNDKHQLGFSSRGTTSISEGS
jgi:hypothetical protein